MNWDAIAAVGQVLGSIAVFITLGYLAVQVGHARAESRRALSQARAEALRDLQIWSCDERINAVVTKAQAAFGAELGPMQAALVQEGFTREEATLLNLHQVAQWSYRVSIIPSVDELPDMERRQFEWMISGNYGSPGVARVFYETWIRPNAHPDAVRYVDNLLAQG
jgi:hypothetical protein